MSTYSKKILFNISQGDFDCMTGMRLKRGLDQSEYIRRNYSGLSTGPRTPEVKAQSLAALQGENKAWRIRAARSEVQTMLVPLK